MALRMSFYTRVNQAVIHEFRRNSDDFTLGFTGFLALASAPLEYVIFPPVNRPFWVCEKRVLKTRLWATQMSFFG